MSELKGTTAEEIKNLIKEKLTVEFCLINDKKITGKLLWHDESSFHIRLDDEKETTILKNAVIYYSALK